MREDPLEYLRGKQEEANKKREVWDEAWRKFEEENPVGVVVVYLLFCVGCIVAAGAWIWGLI